jgi:pimeloyl-ACP methyl ester carboxylesterase
MDVHGMTVIEHDAEEVHDHCVISANGAQLSVATWGETVATTVMIHGFADGKHVWEPFAQELADAGVLTIDLRGHGDSEWDKSGCYDIDMLVADVEAVISQQCGRDLVLVGHSLGAEIAIRVAAARPDSVTGLVLVDGGVGLAPGAADQVRSSFKTRTRDFDSRLDYLNALRDWLPLADDGMLELAAQHAIAQIDGRYSLKCDPNLSQMALRRSDAELLRMLQSLDCERLLIRGEASAVLSRQAAADMVRSIPNLQCETVAMAGHAVMMDNPEAFGSILSDFVLKCARYQDEMEVA